MTALAMLGVVASAITAGLALGVACSWMRDAARCYRNRRADGFTRRSSARVTWQNRATLG